MGQSRGSTRPPWLIPAALVNASSQVRLIGGHHTGSGDAAGPNPSSRLLIQKGYRGEQLEEAMQQAEESFRRWYPPGEEHSA
jgi:hypothetical protein